jgi:hypothetical protein
MPRSKEPLGCCVAPLNERLLDVVMRRNLPGVGRNNDDLISRKTIRQTSGVLPSLDVDLHGPKISVVPSVLRKQNAL